MKHNPCAVLILCFVGLVMFASTAFSASIEEQRIQKVLQRFQEGYRRKDMKLIKSCFWNLDASREIIIETELRQWNAISLEFTNVSIDISGISATVKCHGEIIYTLKKDSSRHQTPRSYTFSFVQARSRWAIQMMNVVGDEFILFDARRKSRGLALLISIYPSFGAGQFYNGDIVKGFAFLGAEMLGYGVAFSQFDSGGNDALGTAGAIVFFGSYIGAIIDAYKSAGLRKEALYNPAPKAALQLQHGSLQLGLPTLTVQKSLLPNFYPETNYTFRLVRVRF
ncbi:MAG: hypothetical protein O7E52_26185 [Candidatus Poribacteria bacterium]|nr:hypothetical protein [Candidatus Poribacteria bacterium]